MKLREFMKKIQAAKKEDKPAVSKAYKEEMTEYIHNAQVLFLSSPFLTSLKLTDIDEAYLASTINICMARMWEILSFSATGRDKQVLNELTEQWLSINEGDHKDLIDVTILTGMAVGYQIAKKEE